mmetsp:Transcript_4597/g.13040  ORF Transcript_4597/g.13040 Transcript_4597/m.13040 type:complete len:211 (-) Transcript_4597:32-664(-)
MPHGAVLPAVVWQSQSPVRLHRVQSSLLERVCRYFVCQTNPSSLLLTIYDDTRRLVVDVPHGELQLLAAVALEAADGLRRPARVMHPYDHVLLSLDLATDDCGRFGERSPAVDGVPIATEPKLAHVRRKQRLSHELCPHFIRFRRCIGFGPLADPIPLRGGTTEICGSPKSGRRRPSDLRRARPPGSRLSIQHMYRYSTIEHSARQTRVD